MHETQYQPVKKICIYWVLLNVKSDNMGLVPYHFDAEYSVVEINSRQHLITETTIPSFVQRQPYFRTLTTHLKYCFGFLSKIYE
jgi:hypothetical protein